MQQPEDAVCGHRAGERTEPALAFLGRFLLEYVEGNTAMKQIRQFS